MKGGYKVLWTDNALDELSRTIEYLEHNFSDLEIRKLALKIESISELISQNPSIFPKSEFKEVYKAVILNHNTMYYRIRGNNIHILSFFSNRLNPNRKKI